MWDVEPGVAEACIPCPWQGEEMRLTPINSRDERWRKSTPSGLWFPALYLPPTPVFPRLGRVRIFFFHLQPKESVKEENSGTCRIFWILIDFVFCFLFCRELSHSTFPLSHLPPASYCPNFFFPWAQCISLDSTPHQHWVNLGFLLFPSLPMVLPSI